ncbi:hypothetical protein MAY67_25445, partial [Escherichia coli]
GALPYPPGVLCVVPGEVWGGAVQRYFLALEEVSFLNKNNMALDFFQYPVEDICRIIFRDKIDLRTAVILDFGITTYDLSPLGDHDPFVWRLLEWPLYDYENFQFVIVQKLASYELDKLNEIIQVEDNK